MRTPKTGFSLVELMIVVAIIGILAAIAIPNFIAMQLKSKRAEVPGNVNGIKTAELAYDAAFDAFIVANAAPSSAAPGKNPLVWETNVGFTTLGWAPDGRVRGQYQIIDATNTDFLVLASCDVDGDGNPANYSSSKSTNATLSTTDAAVY